MMKKQPTLDNNYDIPHDDEDEFEVKEYSKLLSKLMKEQKNKSVDLSTRSSVRFKPDVRTYLKNSADYFDVKPQLTNMQVVQKNKNNFIQKNKNFAKLMEEQYIRSRDISFIETPKPVPKPAIVSPKPRAALQRLTQTSEVQHRIKPRKLPTISLKPQDSVELPRTSVMRTEISKPIVKK